MNKSQAMKRVQARKRRDLKKIEREIEARDRELRRNTDGRGPDVHVSPWARMMGASLTKTSHYPIRRCDD